MRVLPKANTSGDMHRTSWQLTLVVSMETPGMMLGAPWMQARALPAGALFTMLDASCL